MNPEQAAALRKPFDKKTIGVLPKPTRKDAPKGECRECGGWHGLPAVHLDYVGHAATTDRLLAVDPEWSWEPMAVDQFGNPQPDAAGNLWIRLTVCGVTRIGVGDGMSMKERIGDAIRNAAMRFGVALDLWSKEELEHSDGKIGGLEADPEIPEQNFDDPLPQTTDKPMTARTRAHMFALFGDLSIAEDDQLPGINRILGSAYTSRADLTEADAKKVIEVLKQKKVATVAELQGGAA
jgi:hypothetical protein